MKLGAACLVCVGVSALAAPASAHHSFSMFDADKPVTMTGTVKEFEWTSPHSWLRLMVEDKATGKTVQWALEMGSPTQQERVGWKSDSVKPGDKVTVTVYPLKDGSRGGGLVRATFPNGAVGGNGGLRPDAQRSSKFPDGLPAGIYGNGDPQPKPPGN